jgi:hypothetical protein
MKYVLVLLAFLSFNVLAFKPQDIAGAEVKAVGTCNQMTCFVLEKNNKQYVAMGEMDGEGNFTPLAIYIVDGKKLRQIWSVSWIDT